MCTTVEVVVLSFLKTASPGLVGKPNLGVCPFGAQAKCSNPSAGFQHNQGFGFLGSSVVTKPGVVWIAGVAGVLVLVPLRFM